MTFVAYIILGALAVGIGWLLTRAVVGGICQLLSIAPYYVWHTLSVLLWIGIIAAPVVLLVILYL